MTTNVYADRGRLTKVVKLLAAVPMGNDAAANGRCANVLAGYPKSDRKRFAAALKVREPSDETWAALVEAVRDRVTASDIYRAARIS